MKAIGVSKAVEGVPGVRIFPVPAVLVRPPVPPPRAGGVLSLLAWPSVWDFAVKRVRIGRGGRGEVVGVNYCRVDAALAGWRSRRSFLINRIGIKKETRLANSLQTPEEQGCSKKRQAIARVRTHHLLQLLPKNIGSPHPPLGRGPHIQRTASRRPPPQTPR